MSYVYLLILLCQSAVVYEPAATTIYRTSVTISGVYMYYYDVTNLIKILQKRYVSEYNIIYRVNYNMYIIYNLGVYGICKYNRRYYFILFFYYVYKR